MTTPLAQDLDDSAPEPRSLDLHDYWLVIRRRWRQVVVIGMIGALAGVGYSVHKGPTYTATAQVVVSPITEGPQSTQGTQPAAASTQVNMSTEQAIAQSGPVIQRAAAELRVSAAKLDSEAGSRLSVSVPASTLVTSNVLQISWEADSPALARRGADAFANAYLSFRHQEATSQVAALERTLTAQTRNLTKKMSSLSAKLSRASSDSARQILSLRLAQVNDENNNAQSQLATLQTYSTSGGTIIPAIQPTKPSGFSKELLGALGLILGLLIGLAVAFARDLFDDRLRDAAQFEQQLGAVTLAELPSANGGLSGSRGRRPGQTGRPVPMINVAARPDSRAAEAARELRATLVALAFRYDVRTLLVVAADASVSADWVIAELGVAIAESGRLVLTVASDLRGSVLAQIFDVPDAAGLSELLIKGGDPGVLVRRPRQASGAALPDAVSGRLSVLPSGQRTMHALSILDSGRMRDMLASQRETYDFVLLDAPPATAADLVSLAAHVDGVIVLARQRHTTASDIRALRHRLNQVGTPIVGGVLLGRGTTAGGPRPSARPEPAVPSWGTDGRPRGSEQLSANGRPALYRSGPAPGRPDDAAWPASRSGTLKQPQ